MISLETSGYVNQLSYKTLEKHRIFNCITLGI